ncbi:unnamed protein product [Adineta ricciae]|uniref:Uncharacterized protein n=1 Tax=Adineta ricciae TaxID=249248 RepID=A0A815VTM2_ADIRI|nr:unnamed protein product [Adineta ricciae]CAF1534681.1 unnamed protein product [Adineta ricciae]
MSIGRTRSGRRTILYLLFFSCWLLVLLSVAGTWFHSENKWSPLSYMTWFFTPSRQQLELIHQDLLRLILANYPIDAVTHINGKAYDYYSIQELIEQKPRREWLSFPLPDEHSTKAWFPKEQYKTTFKMMKSPSTLSGLAYVKQIYVMTDQSLSDRHLHIKNTFRQQNIPVESIKWQWKWNHTECNSDENKKEIFESLNLVDTPAKGHGRYCSLIMKNFDAWVETANRNLTLALYLEDDAIFVPFFKEKFNRFVYTAIRTGALKIDGPCATSSLSKDSNEWVDQNPVFFIGSCLNISDSRFDGKQPMLSTHKDNPTRCAHAYLFASCSARAVLEQIDVNKNELWTPDFYLNNIVPASPTLQSFWLDPPLVYQGNKAKDLDNISSFRRKTY